MLHPGTAFRREKRSLSGIQNDSDLENKYLRVSEWAFARRDTMGGLGGPRKRTKHVQYGFDVSR